MGPVRVFSEYTIRNICTFLHKQKGRRVIPENDLKLVYKGLNLAGGCLPGPAFQYTAQKATGGHTWLSSQLAEYTAYLCDAREGPGSYPMGGPL
jgi:hypothetical protein